MNLVQLLQNSNALLSEWFEDFAYWKKSLQSVKPNLQESLFPKHVRARVNQKNIKEFSRFILCSKLESYPALVLLVPTPYH